VQDRVAALLMFIGSVSNLPLLTVAGYYYYNSPDKMMEKEIVTEQGYGMGIGGYCRLCPAVTGHSLVALFSLSLSIKDRPLHRTWSSHRFIILRTYLLMKVGRLVTLLSWAPTLSGLIDWRRGYVEV
jgi:hypothetical protein